MSIWSWKVSMLWLAGRIRTCPTTGVAGIVLICDAHIFWSAADGAKHNCRLFAPVWRDAGIVTSTITVRATKPRCVVSM